MYIHLDCNNFFVSCELVSRPELQGTPVVVANDNEVGGGIILALNKEAKAAGLKRGNPLFQVRSTIQFKGVTVIDVHHNLYHRISEQIMQTVKRSEMVLDFVQYSVDEFFGQMPEDDPTRLREYLSQLKELIWTETHIPVSCGAGLSYTLAKTATHYAKRYPAYEGICIMPADKRRRALELLDVNDVWGIGRRSRHVLQTYRILTAWDYAELKRERVQAMFGIRGVRTWLELNGTPAITFSAADKRQKSIMHSRTFARMLNNRQALEREISNYAAAVAIKLRSQQQVCQGVRVFVATNRHREDLPQYMNEHLTRLHTPTNDSIAILNAALQALGKILRDGYQYKQAGVILEQLHYAEGIQTDLFETTDYSKQKRLMQAVDDINRKFGDNQVHFAVQGQEAQEIEQAGFARAHRIETEDQP